MSTNLAKTRRVAAVDIGSNTVHMVIVDIDAVHQFTVVERQVEMVRLGADISALGTIGEERAGRAEATLRAMAEHATHMGAIARLGLATEGVRAASNADAMLARFSAAWGEPIALVTGMEEAALTFWGATSRVQDHALRLGVGDLGGGSCELVVGAIEKIAYATSLPIGSGKLVDLVHPSDPPTLNEVQQLRALADERLHAVPSPVPALDGMIAVGGTATTLARVLGAADILHMADLARAETLLCSTPSATLAAQTGTDGERVRILIGGVVAWQAILARMGCGQMTVSECGVREGAIIAWAHAGDDWRMYVQAAVAGLT